MHWKANPLPVYGDGLNVRDWIFVDDHCSAIDTILHKGKVGEVYNIGGNSEKRTWMLQKNNKYYRPYKSYKTYYFFVPDRKGHDRRYAIDSTKIKKELGWRPKCDFDKGLEMTIDWYLKNKEWWKKIKSGEYKRYYKRCMEKVKGEWLKAKTQ